jgi:Domain of unknown function (DUF6852)/Domain of unknown function (DUF5606)
MNLKDIMAISGKPGLFKFVSQAKNGIIIESIPEKKRIPAYASDKVSALEDIAIFTETDEEKLSLIFDKIFEKEGGKKTINHKSSPDELKAYFSTIVPDYDKERVYVSDMKKVFNWYNILQENKMLIPSEKEEEKTEVKKTEGKKAEGEKKHQ